MTMITTGYCGCDKCNRLTGTTIIYGISAGTWHSSSRSERNFNGKPSVHSRIRIGLAADQGNAIKGNRLDLFFNTHQEALNWGIKTVNVTIW